MSLIEVVVEGTLKPDGTLELHEKPNLSRGRVTVVLRQESQPTTTGDWWEFMQNARKKMEESGCHFLDEKEMQAHIDWLREGDRVDDLLRDAGGQRQKPER